MAVERGDLEGKLRQIEAIVDESASQLKVTSTAVAIGVVVIVIIAFLFGKRRAVKGARVEVFRLR